MDDQHSDSGASMERRTSVATPTNILSLPDDCLYDCFRRLSVIHLPSVALVCRRFSNILRHHPRFTSLIHKQVCFGHDLNHAATLLSVSADLTSLSTVNYLIFDPSGDSYDPYSTTFHVSSFRFPPVVDAAMKLSGASTVVIHRNVYLIGYGFTLCIGLLSGTIRSCAPTIVPRRKFVAVTFEEKIYVIGGANTSRSLEEYDPSTDEWQVVATAPYDLSQCFLGISLDGYLHLYINGCIPPILLTYSFYAKRWTSIERLRGISHAVGACESGRRRYLLMHSGQNVWFVRWPLTQYGLRQSFKEYKWTTERCHDENSLVRIIGCVPIGHKKLCAMIEVEASSESAKTTTEVMFMEFDLRTNEWTRISELVLPFDGAAFTGICGTSDNPMFNGFDDDIDDDW